MRCTLCKEQGHRAAECDRDPNLRTTFDVAEEDQRLGRISVKQKRLADSSDITSKMLQRVTLLSTEKVMSQLLSQDDYNYKPFNNDLLNLNLPIDADQPLNMSYDSKDSDLSQKKEE